MKFDKLQNLIFNALALAMGVASIVLSVLGTSTDTIILLIAIGLTCLSISSLDKRNK